MTSYNQKSLLKRALSSVLNQTYQNIEIIITDDGSTDGSKEWIVEQAGLGSGNITYFLQEQNVGIPRNKNTGFKLAKGEFITYLDGDDTYYPEKVEEEINVFKAHPEYSIVYSNFDFKEYNGDFIKVWADKPLPEGNIFKQIISGMFPHQHLHRFEMFRRDVMHSLNFYDENFSIYHDLDFMIRYSAKYQVGSTLNIGSSYFMNPNSIVSGTKAWHMTKQHRMVYQKLRYLFEENGMKEVYDSYLKESEIKLLFAPPELNIGPYISCLLSQPGKALRIFAHFITVCVSGNDMKQLIRFILQKIRFPETVSGFGNLITPDCTFKKKAILEPFSKLISSNIGEDFKLGSYAICSNINTGKNCRIAERSVAVNSKLGNYTSIGPQSVLHNVTVGNHTYFAQEVLAYHVEIGNFCSVGPRVIFGHGDHPVKRMSTSPEFYTPGSSTGFSFVDTIGFEEFAPIKIGHDVWIGANAYIKHGVTIGNGAIIASGAVVTKDVDAYSIAGGVPAKELKKRFSEEIIVELQRLSWWNWEEEKIRDSITLFKKEELNLEDIKNLI